LADDPKAEGTAYSRTLKRAASLSGGVEALARLLHVKADDLAQWIAGGSRPPQDIFLAALDIVSGTGYEQRAQQSQDAPDRAQAAADRAQKRADRLRAEATALKASAARTRRCAE
jgi:hypothetical protein